MILIFDFQIDLVLTDFDFVTLENYDFDRFWFYNFSVIFVEKNFNDFDWYFKSTGSSEPWLQTMHDSARLQFWCCTTEVFIQAMKQFYNMYPKEIQKYEWAIFFFGAGGSLAFCLSLKVSLQHIKTTLKCFPYEASRSNNLTLSRDKQIPT